MNEQILSYFGICASFQTFLLTYCATSYKLHQRRCFPVTPEKSKEKDTFSLKLSDLHLSRRYTHNSHQENPCRVHTSLLTMASFSRRRGLVAAAGSPVGLLLFLVVLLRSSSVHAFATPKSTARLSSTRLYVTVPPPVKEPQTNMKQTINDKSEQSDGTSQAATQNVFGSLSDAVTGSMFSLLHAFDDTPIEDSSKNLRVLWVRALLETAGRIDDPVASKLLPSKTRGLVTAPATAKLLEPVLQFTEWIQARTDFIDEGLEHFFTSPVCTNEATGKATPCNVVLIGAGYDTRALRNRHAHDHQANFFEVDLPSVVTGKRALYEKFQREHDAEWNQNDITLVGLDLNTCEDETSLVETLRQAGLNSDVPTFVVFEAVLFYVNQAAVTKIFQELSDFAANEKHAETMLCFTDSLKPFVDVPFSNQARIFFNANGMDLLEHRSRWGGAVHFCLAASRRAVSDTISESDATTTVSIKTPDKAAQFSGTIANHVGSRVGGLVNSYTPTASNNKALLTKPSFENVWYAVAYPWQIDGYDTPLDAAIGRRNKETASKPFATRLWGEPIIIYRDVKNELVAMADVCPHRSVPLSMGKLENGQVQCMYHGWTFGEKGACVDVPTLRTVDDDGNLVNNKNRDKAFLDGVTKANCGNGRAVVEHEGIVYVWRGNVLEADLSLLQSRRKGDMEAVPIDTVLDYSVDYSYIVENNLDSPHLFYLHDGSVPPIESIGMLNENLKKLRLTAFTDDCGMGHLGKLGNGRPKKLIRFDPPNIVRHGGVSGFEEEFHIIPIAPQRTRVLLRQYLPRGPILSTVTSFPFVVPLLTILVNNWNYHIGEYNAV